MIQEPISTLQYDYKDEQDMYMNGFFCTEYKDKHPNYVYICYRVINHNVVRITIVNNVFAIMAKQQYGELFIFKAIQRDNANQYANDEIIKYNTGQHLFGVMTVRQALYKVHKWEREYKKTDFDADIKRFNETFYRNEHIYHYGNDYISREVIETIVDYLDFKDYESKQR